MVVRDLEAVFKMHTFPQCNWGPLRRNGICLICFEQQEAILQGMLRSVILVYNKQEKWGKKPNKPIFSFKVGEQQQ